MSLSRARSPGDRFRVLSGWTVAAVYLLILVGGIVRASGAGMGCPDWPKCFGSWVPPTRESQLPENYREIWSERGYAEAPFNAVKTWTEYVNRLVGVSIGLLIFATFVASLTYRKSAPAIVAASLGALVMVGFEGWLGSILVETNLAGWSVSVHLAGALAVVVLLLYALTRAYFEHFGAERLLGLSRLGPLFTAAILLSLLQIGLGTQVRSRVDELVGGSGQDVATWIRELGASFYVHRSLSIVVLVVNVILVYRIRRATLARGKLHLTGSVLMAALLLEIVVGVGLYYLRLPAVLQPPHMLLAAVCFGLQMTMWFMYRSESRHSL